MYVDLSKAAGVEVYIVCTRYYHDYHSSSLDSAY